MRDCFDKTSAEQARTFQVDVLGIVSQIPSGRVMTYGLIATPGWLAEPRKDGRANTSLHTLSRVTALSQSRQRTRAHGSRMETAARTP